MCFSHCGHSKKTASSLKCPSCGLTISLVFSDCRGKTGFAIAINLMYGMASLSSTFALLLVTESSIKSKHVQQVSGVYLSNFWFSALLWDLVNFLLPCLLMLVSVTPGIMAMRPTACFKCVRL